MNTTTALALKITVSDRNSHAINQAIADAEGRAAVRCLAYSDVEDAVTLAERRLAALPKRLWTGVTAHYAPYAVPKSYGSPAKATSITITRTATRWALTGVTRGYAPSASYGERSEVAQLTVTLPSDTDATELLDALLRHAHLDYTAAL
jgi:hypothetical protein